jgi:hypothetical protein
MVLFERARGALLEAVTSRAESHNCDGWDRVRCYPTLRTLSERVRPMESMHIPDNWMPTEHILKPVSSAKAAPIAVVFTIVLFCSTAVAETSEERQACIGDAFRVCWAAIPNRHDVFVCLIENRNRLTHACRVVMDQYRRRPHRITRTTRTTRVE